MMVNPVKESKGICFIINPFSGGSGKDSIIDRIKKHLDQDIYSPCFHLTEFPGHARQLSREAMDNGTPIIVAVGGDGTINEVAAPLTGSGVTLGIISMGSGNGLARHLGIPRSVDAAVRLINEAHCRSMDTATVNGIPFFSVAGIGFDALVARQFANSRRRGFSRYAMLTASNFFKYRPRNYKLTLEDGKLIEAKALMIVFANANQFGYNAQISPHADLHDGKLDICILEKPALHSVPATLLLLMTKKMHLSPYLRIIRSGKVQAAKDQGTLLNLDGEAIEMKGELIIETLKDSLNVITAKNV